MLLELSTLGFLLVCWVVFFAHAVAGYPLAGALPLSLYPLYAIAVLTGLLSGNVVVYRTRDASRSFRRRLILGFLLCPGGLFYLLWSLAPVATRQAAPFAPLYASIIFAIFFLVPVSFRQSASPPTIGRR